MCTICNIDIDRREEVYEELKRFITRLKEEFPVLEVYLYGSFATGEIHEGSDIDLIVIGNFEGKMPHRIAQIITLTDLPVEPLVYTPQEFTRMKKDNSFLKEVLKTAERL